MITRRRCTVAGGETRSVFEQSLLAIGLLTPGLLPKFAQASLVRLKRLDSALRPNLSLDADANQCACYAGAGCRRSTQR